MSMAQWVLPVLAHCALATASQVNGGEAGGPVRPDANRWRAVAVAVAGEEETSNSRPSVADEPPGQDYQDSLLSVVLAGDKVDSPRIVVAPNGRLLVCARRIEPAPSSTMVYESADEGQSWEMIHDFEHSWYGPSLFTIGDTLYMFLRGATTTAWLDLVLLSSRDNGRTWNQSVLLEADAHTKRLTTGNTPILVTEDRIIAAVTDWGGTGNHFPEFFRLFCGWCPRDQDPMDPANWTWTERLEMPSPNRAPHDKGGWLEPNPVVDPDGNLLLIVRVDSDDGELGAVVRVDMETATLEFTDRFPAQPGQSGFIRMPGGGNGMFFLRYDPQSKRYLALANPRTGAVSRLWGHQRIRNCLALFESTDLYHWRWVRALVKDDQGRDWKSSADRAGFQQPSYAILGDDLYAVSRTAYGDSPNWHDANRITVHKLPDFRRYLDSDGEVARYTFDDPGNLGADRSRQGGNPANVCGATYDPDGRHGGCARFDGRGHLDLRYRVGSELHYAEQITLAAWINAEAWGGSIIHFPIDGSKSGIELALRPEGKLLVGGRSRHTDEFQKMTFPYPGLDAWHHVLVMIDYPGKVARVWVDGREVAGEGRLDFGNSYYKRRFPAVMDRIGKQPEGGAGFRGRLDDLRLWRRALSVEEIRALPKADASPPRRQFSGL